MINGLSSGNVDTISWKLAGQGRYHVVRVSGTQWKAKVIGLKKGRNLVLIFGVNTSTGERTSVLKAVVVRK